MNKLFGSVCLVLLVATSCGKKDQPFTENTKTIYTDRIVLNLEADVASESNEARSVGTIKFLGQDKNGKIYPKLHVPEGVTFIPVHTAIANLRGTIYGAKTLNWAYTPAKDGQPATLRCPIDQDIELLSESQFTPGNETFYVTAIIEGDLLNRKTPNQKVDFSGNTDLKGIASVGETIADLKAPFAMPWTKLKIFKDKQKNIGTSRFSSPQGGDNYRPLFKPQGSFVGFRIENTTTGTLIPEEIYLRTQQFGLSGSFDLHKPNIRNGQGDFPTWNFSPCAHTMTFTFNNVSNAGNIAPNKISDKVFYTWVMANPSTNSSTGISSATIYGSSSDKTNAPLNNYWSTSFTGSKKPLNHTSHQIKLLVKNNTGVRMPIEDFTNYNIAGGDEYRNLQYKYDPNVPGALKNWEGRSGAYRLTSGDKATHSGMYNGYMVRGIRHHYFNPMGHDLERLEIKEIEELQPNGTLVSKRVGPYALNEQYYIPADEDYSGLIPYKAISWNNSHSIEQTDEKVRLGGGSSHPMIITSKSAYSPMRQNTPKSGYKRFYGIRFKDATTKVDNSDCRGHQFKVRLASAFRYTYEFVRGVSGVLRVEVVYLGNEANGLTLTQLEGMPESFWTEQNKKGDNQKGVFVRSVKFAAVGDLQSAGFSDPSGPSPFTTSSPELSKPHGYDFGHYYARSESRKKNGETTVIDWADGWEIKIDQNQHHKGMPVRVFKKNE